MLCDRGRSGAASDFGQVYLDEAERAIRYADEASASVSAFLIPFCLDFSECAKKPPVFESGKMSKDVKMDVSIRRGPQAR